MACQTLLKLSRLRLGALLILCMSVKFHGLKVDGYIREGSKLSGLYAERVSEFRMPASAGLRGFMNMSMQREHRLVFFQELINCF